MKLSSAVLALALCLAGSAFAQSTPTPVRAAPAPLTLTLHQPQHADDFAFNDGYGRRGAPGVIFSDALYGGLIGLVIGTAVALIANDFNNGGWGRDLAVGAGVGIIAGGIFGALDLGSNSDRVLLPGDRMGRDRGFSRSLGLRASF